MSKRSGEPVQAAGGIVVRAAPEPLVAIVRLRKNRTWVLPKGKLKSGEDARAAAKREVMEETGHDVSVHEFLGEMAEAPGAKPKTVKFWHMQANATPARKPMRDVKAVKWLPLEDALGALTHPHERSFLAQFGPVAIRASRAADAPIETGAPQTGVPEDSFIKPIWAWLRGLLPRGT
jgi:8-oxo-dGTP diphosphatase